MFWPLGGGTFPIFHTKFRSTSNCTTRQVLGWKKRIEVMAVKAALTLDVGVVGKPGMVQGLKVNEQKETNSGGKKGLKEHTLPEMRWFCGIFNEWHIPKNRLRVRLHKKWMYLYSFFWKVEDKMSVSRILWLIVPPCWLFQISTCPTWPHSCEIEDVILFGFRFFERSPTMRHQHEAWYEDPKKHLLIMWRFNPAAVHKWYMPKYSIFYILLRLFGTS